METADLARFSELVQAAAEQRSLELGELHEIGALLSEAIQAASTLASYAEAETATLSKRYLLRDTTGATDPGARLAEVRARMARIVDSLQKADLHARRSHATIGRIVQADPDATVN